MIPPRRVPHSRARRTLALWTNSPGEEPGALCGAARCEQRLKGTQQDYRPVSREAPAGTLHLHTGGAMCLWSQGAVIVGFMREEGPGIGGPIELIG